MNDRYIAYFEALAKGGLALASSAVQPMEKGPMPGFRILGDEYIPGWAKWADAVHKYDSLAFHQLFHLGGMSPLFAMAPPGVAASSIPKELSPRPHFEVAREITIAEIQDVVELFASSAERMKKAGLDGTELNGACNHLINSFLSRAWNKRQDEYGPQTMQNRTRLFVQIIQEIKRRNGADWPVIALFNGMEPDLQDGITIDESKQFAQILEKAGADAMEIRAEFYTWTKDPKRRDSTHVPGAQVCFEAAGNPASVQTCIDLCMNSGQVMMIGNDGRPYQLVTAAVGHRQLDLKFSFVYTKEEILMLFDLIAKGRIDTRPYSIMKAPLDIAVKMLDDLADGKIECARVLLMPHGEE